MSDDTLAPRTIHDLAEYGGEWNGNLNRFASLHPDPVESLHAVNVELQRRAEDLYQDLEDIRLDDERDYDELPGGYDYHKGQLDALRSASMLVGQATMTHDERRPLRIPVDDWDDFQFVGENTMLELVVDGETKAKIVKLGDADE